MSPASLRAQILMSLGLVSACKGEPPPESPASEARIEPVAAPPGPASSASPAGRTCAVDEVLEQVCGQMQPVVMQPFPFSRCGSSATDIARPMPRYQRTLDRFGYQRDPAALASFALDPGETLRALRGEMHAPSEVDAEKTQASLCCYTRCTRLSVAQQGDPVPVDHQIVPTCVPAPQRGTSVPSERASKCPAALHLDGRAVALHHGRDDRCCYATSRPACPPNARRGGDGECHYPKRGRPLREDGRAIVARAEVREGWACVDAARDDDRRDHARAVEWLTHASEEHSSVAAFARLSLELLALGAPADLVRDCHVAAIEEIEHARLSYGIASRLGGLRLGPGPLAVDWSKGARDVVEVARETFLDGCVGETHAALEAAATRDGERDEDIRATLAVIARDEASHAALAFRILAWTLDAGGRAVRDAVDSLLAELDEDSVPVRDVVVPCTRAVLTRPEISRKQCAEPPYRLA